MKRLFLIVMLVVGLCAPTFAEDDPGKEIIEFLRKMGEISDQYEEIHRPTSEYCRKQAEAAAQPGNFHPNTPYGERQRVYDATFERCMRENYKRR